ncbi:MAG: AbrB/MazE/SpoVT family DNA-binding domain-containing protein [Gammaproteobacteria bacterium]|nr:AbrB/MazE/SpoVT family DNA-binding domain-containing protein [Gammaproteobacteria bacterium]
MNQATTARELKVVAIGNSRGIRLPRELLRQYGWSDFITMEAAEDGVFLRGRRKARLSWKDTYRAMAAADENWREFDAVAGDGID